MNQLEACIAVLLAAIMGVLLGWGIAHAVVASECDKLGGFYVNDTVYECRQKKVQNT